MPQLKFCRDRKPKTVVVPIFLRFDGRYTPLPDRLHDSFQICINGITCQLEPPATLAITQESNSVDVGTMDGAGWRTILHGTANTEIELHIPEIYSLSLSNTERRNLAEALKALERSFCIGREVALSISCGDANIWRHFQVFVLGVCRESNSNLGLVKNVQQPKVSGSTVWYFRVLSEGPTRFSI